MPARSTPIIHDITFGLSSASTVWPEDTPVRVKRLKEVGTTSQSTLSELTLSSHAGTHVDAPLHFVPQGNTVESLNLNTLVGDVLVVEVKSQEISSAVLDALSIPDNVERLIFKTSNSERFGGTEPFFENYVGLTPSGADWLIRRGIKLVGSDYLSIAAYQHIQRVHQLLLGSGVVLLETLNLKSIQAGWYDLICLPLKLDGADGAPSRAVLIEK